MILTERATRFYDPKLSGIEKEKCILVAVDTKLETRRTHVDSAPIFSLKESLRYVFFSIVCVLCVYKVCIIVCYICLIFFIIYVWYVLKGRIMFYHDKSVEKLSSHIWSLLSLNWWTRTLWLFNVSYNWRFLLLPLYEWNMLIILKSVEVESTSENKNNLKTVKWWSMEIFHDSH